MRTLKTLRPELIIQRRSAEPTLVPFRVRTVRVPGRPDRRLSSAYRGRPHRSSGAAFPRPRSAAQRVALRIHWGKTDLRQRIKSNGGRWDPHRRFWLLRRYQPNASVSFTGWPQEQVSRRGQRVAGCGHRAGRP